MNTLEELPLPIRDHIQSLLLPGESVVWVGQSDIERSLKNTRGDRIGIQVSAVLVGLLGLFFACVLPFFIGLPLLLVAGWLVWLMWRQTLSSREKYLLSANVISNQRPFAVCVFRQPTVTSYDPKNLVNMEIKEEPDGSGSVVFYRTQYEVGAGDTKATRTLEHGFFFIPGVREAERHLRSLIPPIP